MGRKRVIDDTALLAHARAVFLERGAFGTTKDIAQRAGVSEAVIFQRFPTKAALFLAAMLPPDVDADAIVASKIADTRAALVETGRRLLAHYRTIIPTAVHLMTNPAISMAEVATHFGEDPNSRIVSALAGFLKERTEQGLLRVENPMASASLLIAAIHSLALFEMMEFHQGDDLTHAVPLFVDALWSGLVPGPAPNDGS
ncbi:TetR/AcrR family transcriptional regulator [Azospirillum sp. sgz302134]